MFARVAFGAKLIAGIFVLTWALPLAAQGLGGADSIQAIQSALRGRDFAQALQLLQAQLRNSPRDPKLWMFQGLAYEGLGKNHEALSSFDKALAIAPDYLPALEGAADLEFKAGSPRAVPHLNRILKQLPDDPTTHAMLATLAYKQHDCPTAAKHFAQSERVIANEPAALAAYGDCLMDLQRAAEAIPVFRQLVAEFPDNLHARYDLAVAQNANHDAKGALETLQPMLEQKEPDPDALALASSAYEEQGDTPKAVELLRQAIVLNPKNVKYYLDFATLSFNHQSFKVGIDMVNVGVKQLPKAAPLYVARGVLYVQLAQYDKGEADFQTAMRLDPSQASSAVAQGMAQIQSSNLDEALNTVNSQLKLHPKEAFLYYLKAQILVRKGTPVGSAEFKEAVAAASKATKLDPASVLPRDVLSNLYLSSGQLDLAIEQCRLALKGNPSDQEALYHLIQALRQSGKGSKTEMASLVKKLAELRNQSRQQESTTNKYQLYETPPTATKDQTPQQ
jgi:tetratricopeptide (TPR) repeat protein